MRDIIHFIKNSMLGLLHFIISKLFVNFNKLGIKLLIIMHSENTNYFSKSSIREYSFVM